MHLSVESFAAPDALPADCAALLAAAARQDFALSAAWFQAVLAAAMPAGARAEFLLCRGGGRPLAIFPMRRTASGLAALSTPYTCRWQPLAAPDAGADDLCAAGAAFGRFCARFGAVRLEAMDADWPGLEPLLAGIRAAGLRPLRFAHFGNWHASVAGCGWDGYLAARPGALRETIRRRLRRLSRDPAIALEVLRGDDPRLQQGIAAYETVYAQSWKQPEPFPAFSAALMRVAAAAGVLRLGILRRDGRPVAAQYWIVADGTAQLAKLAHAEAERAWSPGTLLTAAMVHGLLEEGVAGLDFGRGDDAYKADWAEARRQRIGFVLADPRRVRGIGHILRHLAGQAVRLARGEARGGIPIAPADRDVLSVAA